MTSPEKYESAENVRTSEGRQYHIGLAPGEVASNIILVGDPARARRWGAKLELEGEWSHREYVTVTGAYHGLRLSIMATGIGADNTEIAVVELKSLLEGEVRIIRAGTSGGLDPAASLGDLVVTWGAVRLETTSLAFVPSGYPAVAHPEIAQSLRHAARELDLPHHFGMTATAAGFYGAQGRQVAGFPVREPQLTEELAQIGVKNLEMEASSLLTLAALAGWRAGAVCTLFARRGANEFVRPRDKIRFEDRAVGTALAALFVAQDQPIPEPLKTEIA